MKTRQIISWLLCAASPALAQVSPWSSGTYAYDGGGNIKAIGADYYVYDQAGRLIRGTADKERSGLDSYQTYTYDAFGNRLTATTTGTQCVNGCGVNVQVNNMNRVIDHGATYDAAGNLQHFDTSYYTYDGAGMLVTVSSSPTSADAQYIYTANDERLAIYTGGGNWRFTIRDLDAKVVREVTAFQSGGSTTWTWHRDHIFRDGLLLATVLPEGTQHYHLDHLGTPRLVTDGTGRKLGVHAYYPFGVELNLGLAELLSPERLKYTGHERDDASNGTSLDDMHARYYSPIQARFVSVDPDLDIDKSTSEPQKWNRYTYVMNNPLRYNDPTGRDEQEGWKAGVVVNRSSQTIWVAGDHDNQVIVVPLKPGERSDSYLVDTDAIIPGPGQSIDGETSGAFKIGASVVSVDGNGPQKIGINRGLDYVANAAVGHAGHVDPATAKQNGWVAPATPKGAADASKKAAEAKKRKQQHEQQKRAEAEKTKSWWQFWR